MLAAQDQYYEANSLEVAEDIHACRNSGPEGFQDLKQSEREVRWNKRKLSPARRCVIALAEVHPQLLVHHEAALSLLLNGAIDFLLCSA